MPYLVLARHGESQFNAKSLWTGNWDVPLTKKGRHEATLMAKAMHDIKPALAYTSVLSRATGTLSIILATNHWKPKVYADAALNERDYGDLTGMNKWAVEEQYGEAQFNKWRRGWNEPVPEGETLKDVYARVVPYFQKHILPNLKDDKNVLIAAHGNTLRTLMKHLDKLSDQRVQSLEMPFGEIIIYNLTPAGSVEHKETRKITRATPA
ncbi:MAG: phosphoglyceromutase [Patescibacteria group bacterium]|nr:phosphoglyceromutase [Patescibacteria group bacterium]